MGVRRFNYIVSKLVKKKHVLRREYDHFYLDGNCCLHDVVCRFNEAVDYRIPEFEDTLTTAFDARLGKVTAKHYHIVFDGIPPKPKQLTQIGRREKNVLSSFILPGTKLMSHIEGILSAHYSQRDDVVIYSSSERGEGEQKIFKYMAMQVEKGQTVLVYSVDSDVIILAQIFILTCKVEAVRIDVSIEPTDDTYKLFVNVNTLNSLFFGSKIELTVTNLLLFCCLCGNDFFPVNIDAVGVNEDTPPQERLYKAFSKFKITKFSDLCDASSSCLKQCHEDDILAYANVWLWYNQYFLTSDLTLDVEPFVPRIKDATPCFGCVAAAIESGVELKLRVDSGESHLEYVLPKQLLQIELDETL